MSVAGIWNRAPWGRGTGSQVLRPVVRPLMTATFRSGFPLFRPLAPDKKIKSDLRSGYDSCRPERVLVCGPVSKEDPWKRNREKVFRPMVSGWGWVPFPVPPAIMHRHGNCSWLSSV